MKTTANELDLHRWPHGLELQPSANGLLLRPRRKARANWMKNFRRPRLAKDDLAEARPLTNEFDKTDWQW